MKTFASLLTALFACAALTAAVPSEINYQGRLTDANGDAVTGDVTMSLKMFDAATAGNEIYSEDIGSVTLDSNGVYSFEFGAGGQSVVDRTDTIAVADGSATTYTESVSSTPLSGTLSVADGTYSWNIFDGNPGQQATATAQLVNGFVVGITVSNGGEGYTTEPVVTINGNGTAATATAVVENGVLTAINVDTTGSGYTNATVSIGAPPAPYVVDYSAGTVTVTYESAPTAGTEIVASYEANDSSIVGALSAVDAHWLELSVNGSGQSPRERVLSVPFAQVAGNSVQNKILTTQLDKYVGTIALNTFRNDTNAPVYLDSNFVCIYPSARLPELGAVEWPYRALLTLENPTFVRYTYGMRNDLPTTFNYEDGTSSNAINGSETSWANPHPGKKVASVSARYTDTNNTKNIRAVLLEPVYEIINIENIPSHASKVFVTINSINYLSTDIATIEVNGQLGSQILKENEYTELNASIGQINSVTVGIIPTKLETGYTSPYISGISLRFL